MPVSHRESRRKMGGAAVMHAGANVDRCHDVRDGGADGPGGFRMKRSPERRMGGSGERSVMRMTRSDARMAARCADHDSMIGTTRSWRRDRRLVFV